MTKNDLYNLIEELEEQAMEEEWDVMELTQKLKESIANEFDSW